MALELINTGLTPNDGLGDSPLEVATKLNRMLAALFGGMDELRDLIAAGGLNAATLENTLITAGIPVDHVQGLASQLLGIAADITALDADFAALNVRINALEA